MTSNYGITGHFPKFSDIFSTANEFLAEYKASGIYLSNEDQRLSDNDMKTLYYLLYSEYGNSTIMSSDRNRFLYKLWSIVFSYGPTWVAKLALQKKIRSLTDTELTAGSKVIHNHAYNPGTSPSTDELSAINEQNTSTYIRPKSEAYGNLWTLLASDVTKEFIKKFHVLFKVVVYPNDPLLYPPIEGDDYCGIYWS